MTQYDDRVERQRLLLEAEEWAKGVKDVHCFNTLNCKVWYESRPEDGRVIDIRYNDGRIERELRPSGQKIWLGNTKRLQGAELIDAYTQNLADSNRG